MTGRFAPSPTSALHLGNLRTAVIAYALAKTTGHRFVLRIEDLDQQRVAAAPGIARSQLSDLATLGLTWDECVWQSERLDSYQAALAQLKPWLYECFCTRKDIAAAAQAPHDGFRAYPGTCRNRTEAERIALRASGRSPALRIRAEAISETIQDRWAGPLTGVVDDFVVQRGDGVFAYNLAVVIDDIAQGVTQVVRGADLLSSSPRQAWLTKILGGVVPEYAHVPLVLGPDGRRLAKRDGDVTLADLGVQKTLSLIAVSLGLAEDGEIVSLDTILDRFNPEALPSQPWIFYGSDSAN